MNLCDKVHHEKETLLIFQLSDPSFKAGALTFKIEAIFWNITLPDFDLSNSNLKIEGLKNFFGETKLKFESKDKLFTLNRRIYKA